MCIDSYQDKESSSIDPPWDIYRGTPFCSMGKPWFFFFFYPHRSRYVKMATSLDPELRWDEWCTHFRWKIVFKKESYLFLKIIKFYWNIFESPCWTKYQNFKLRQAVCFMTLHYWAMGAVLFSQPMIPSHWLPPLAGLWGLTMVNKQIRQCRALYIAIVLIEGLLLAFSTWFKLWKNILIRIFKVLPCPFATGSSVFKQDTKKQILYWQPTFYQLVVGRQCEEGRVHLGTFSREGSHHRDQTRWCFINSWPFLINFFQFSTSCPQFSNI